MGFLHFESTLKPFINMCGMIGKNEKRMDLKDQGNPTIANIISFLGSVISYSNNDLQQKQFEEDLALFIVKDLVPLSFVKAPFFQRLILRQNPCFNFPFSRVLVNEVLLTSTEKMKENYISSTLESYNTCMVSFDLWMFRMGVDTFILIVHFLNDKWEPCHVTIGFFEIVETFGNAMALQVNEVFAKHGFNVWVIVYVKDEGDNFSTMTTALISVVLCEILGLTTPFVGACWGHAMSKCC
jgi:hypothetical protein